MVGETIPVGEMYSTSIKYGERSMGISVFDEERLKSVYTCIKNQIVDFDFYTYISSRFSVTDCLHISFRELLSCFIAS